MRFLSRWAPAGPLRDSTVGEKVDDNFVDIAPVTEVQGRPVDSRVCDCPISRWVVVLRIHNLILGKKTRCDVPVRILVAGRFSATSLLCVIWQQGSELAIIEKHRALRLSYTTEGHDSDDR